MESTPFAMRMCQKLMNYLQYSAIFLKASSFFFGIDNYHQLNWMSRRGLEVTFKNLHGKIGMNSNHKNGRFDSLKVIDKSYKI